MSPQLDAQPRRTTQLGASAAPYDQTRRETPATSCAPEVGTSGAHDVVERRERQALPLSAPGISLAVRIVRSGARTFFTFLMPSITNSAVMTR